MTRVRWALVLCVVAAGCAVTRQGTLQMAPGGVVIPVTVTVEGDSVTVTGTRPDTGERLTGRLQKEAGAGAGSGSWYPSSPTGGAPMPGGMGGVGGGAGTESTLTLAGRLEGDKGSTLRCVVAVERRLRLRGGGICRVEGAADDAPAYRLKF